MGTISDKIIKDVAETIEKSKTLESDKRLDEVAKELKEKSDGKR